MDREAVAIDPDHVDVAGPLRDTLAENARAFVDHREQQAFDDLVLADGAACDAALRRRVDDQPLDLGIGLRRARARLVEIESAPGLLAEAAALAQLVGDRRREPLRLAHAPAHVEAGEVRHGERPHRKAEVGERAHRHPAAARLRAAGARPRPIAGAACGCRRSRGTRRPPPAPCRACGRPRWRWRAPPARSRRRAPLRGGASRSPG